MNLRRIPMVEVTGLEPAASWSQTTRATNCATPRSYNLFIIIHKRCGRQVPARQKSYSQAEQPQHQQVRGVEGIEEPLVKRAPAGGAPAIVQVQDHKRGDKDRHSAADGLPHLPGGRKTFAMWLISMVSMATILMESRDMVKTPFVFIVKYEGAGVKIAAVRQHFCGPLFLLPCACAIMKYREAIGTGKTTQLCRKGRTFLCAGHLLCAGVCDRAVCVRYYD